MEDLDLSDVVDEIQVHLIRIEARATVAHRAEHTAPVRVATIDRRLRERRGNDGTCERPGLLLVLCLGDMNREEVGCTLTISRHLARQGLRHLEERGLEGLIVLALRIDDRILRSTVCEDHAGIIRRGIAIDGDHVEGIDDVLAEGLLQQLLRDREIGRQEADHRTHLRMDHAGALRHTAEVDLLPADREFECELLIRRIGRHDGLAGCGSGCLARLELRNHFGNRILHLLDRKLQTDDAGGCQQHGIRRNHLTEGLRGRVGLLLADIQSQLTGAGIGDTRVDDGGMDRAATIDQFTIPEDRCRLHHVAREGTGHDAWLFGKNHRHIIPTLRLDLRSGRRCHKPLGSTDATLDCYHSHDYSLFISVLCPSISCADR